MIVTDSIKRALRILEDWQTAHPEGSEMSPKAFARRMWPTTPRWNRKPRTLMPRAGGAYLGKLRSYGLITGRGHLTEYGEEALGISKDVNQLRLFA